MRKFIPILLPTFELRTAAYGAQNLNLITHHRGPVMDIYVLYHSEVPRLSFRIPR